LSQKGVLVVELYQIGYGRWKNHVYETINVSSWHENIQKEKEGREYTYIPSTQTRKGNDMMVLVGTLAQKGSRHRIRSCGSCACEG